MCTYIQNSKTNHMEWVLPFNCMGYSLAANSFHLLSPKYCIFTFEIMNP